jgi:putative hydrolase of the HAD superfamily
MQAVLPWRRVPRYLALALVGALALAGCNLQLLVEIEVAEDGSGVVTAGVGLDAAAQSLGAFKDVEGLVVLDDLEAAGWIPTPYEQQADGLKWLEVSKTFTGPDELQSVLDELTGPDGAFEDWAIERDFTSIKTEYVVGGTVDLAAGLELFSDEELAELLEEPLGISRESIERDLDQTLEESVTMRVVLRLPDQDEVVTEIDLGRRQAVSASSLSENRPAQLLSWARWALIALLGLALVLAGVNYLLDRRYQRDRPRRRPTRMSSRMPATPARSSVAHQTSSPRTRPLQLLVLDLHRVLFRTSGEPEDRLIPFIREKGSAVADSLIIDLFHEGSLGRLTSAELWDRAGVSGDPAELDAEYVAGFRLQSGAKEFLREMHRRGMPIAVVSNDLAEWSYGLRDLHGMQGMMPWIVSAEIGVRKPDAAAFEAVRRLTGLPYQSCLVIDGSLECLDMAKSLGMMTAWFTRTAPEDSSAGHPVVARFGDFFHRRRPAKV